MTAAQFNDPGWNYDALGVSVMLGKTLTEVRRYGDDALEFVTTDGDVYMMWHSQDCCESVSLESVTGDLQDLVGEPLLLAEEVASSENPPDFEVPEYQDSFTWTFYKFATRKGYVDLRWYGESNGYYSESVSFAVRKD